MKAISLIVAATLTRAFAFDPGAALSVELIWGTVLVWMTVLFVLAVVVASLARQARPQLHRDAGAFWVNCTQLCTACVR